jgi:RHS repeat-associated protein
VYDEDGTLIADTLAGGASTTWGQSAKYIYLPTASGPMPIAAIYGSTHYAIQSDHLNTPRRLIQSDGQVAWQWSYSAFGDEKPTIAKNRFANTDLNQSFGTTTVPAVTFNLRYPGQYFDQESNLHYNYHRSYSAAVGRYTQSDPIGLDGGWNRFGYVGQNPLSFTDPKGLIAPAIVACAASAPCAGAVILLCATAGKAISDAISKGYMVQTYDCTNDGSCPVDDKDKDNCDKNLELDIDKCYEQFGNGLRGTGFASALNACLTHARSRRDACYAGRSDPGSFNGNGWTGGKNR